MGYHRQVGHPPESDRRSRTRVYAPTDEEIALAERNVAAYREGEQKGLGAVGVNGVLVDAAHVKMAEATLQRAALIGKTR